ncbi:hypothetical protein HT136_14805 [Novosphingobium profundi]|uniref:hypothetical protein n=1 Tax=Novosphingobium profundi TaxID=1774954 RepID=UPI001BD9EFE2|nr:hypothetical protein [Novosphingobium profundi]MBT0669635.1 hypothetical protein [Novosphingobium profundi]
MDAVLSLLVLTAIALVVGAVVLWRRAGYRKQAVLMLVLAAVMAANVTILTVPTRSGETLAAGAPKERAPQ